MTLQKHIANICRLVNMHTNKINSIGRYLSDRAVITFGTIDCYCSHTSICIGLPMYILKRFQLLQNSVLRGISQTKRYTSIKPILDQLLWLPINKQCQFKIQLSSFESFLCDMLNVYIPNRFYELLYFHYLCRIEIEPCD